MFLKLSVALWDFLTHVLFYQFLQRKKGESSKVMYPDKKEKKRKKMQREWRATFIVGMLISCVHGYRGLCPLRFQDLLWDASLSAGFHSSFFIVYLPSVPFVKRNLTGILNSNYKSLTFVFLSPCCIQSWGFSFAFWLGYSNSALNPVRHIADDTNT